MNLCGAAVPTSVGKGAPVAAFTSAAGVSSVQDVAVFFVNTPAFRVGEVDGLDIHEQKTHKYVSKSVGSVGKAARSQGAPKRRRVVTCNVMCTGLALSN